MLEQAIAKLTQRKNLRYDDVHAAVESLIDERVDAQTKADFLIALADKGETVEEITAFARELRMRCVKFELDPLTRAGTILDVCGTGGDRLNTFNISTTVAIIAAAAGISVAKHGNRAITSQTGSADVLEALGIPVDLPAQQAAEELRVHHFAFFYAPQYHPAFKHIAPARKLCAALGKRTLFNFIGPLLNPARPTAQLMGVARPELCGPIAEVLQSLQISRAIVVSGAIESGSEARHLDEFSTLGVNSIAEFYQGRGMALSKLMPDDFPIQSATLEDLAGGDRFRNAEIISGILKGNDHGPRRDAVLLNAAAALFVAENARSITEGWDIASRIIDSGQATQKLSDLSRRRAT